MKARILAIAMSVALLPSLASAQTSERKVHFNIGGGPTWSLGDTGKRFGVGWGPAVGIALDLNHRNSIQFEYAYRWHPLDYSAGVPAGASALGLDANHSWQQFSLNLQTKLNNPDSKAVLYTTFGPSFYWRQVEILKYTGTGIICDPWLYVCGSYPVGSVIGSRSSWDMGVNAGVGIDFKIGDSARFYVESRYHYMWGPEIKAGANIPVPIGVSSTQKANGQYIPLTFGFRF